MRIYSIMKILLLERSIDDCESLIDLLIKIEELGFTDLLRVDLPELNNSALNDCFKIDLQNDLCNLHVSNFTKFHNFS
jgi:hypothetical protein